MTGYDNKEPEEDILLHTCCGPCASGCFSMLDDAGRHYVMFFSNSNLADETEYRKRLAAAREAAAHAGVELIADPYDHAAWLKAVSVLPDYEREPERGARCRLCFRYSLSRTAEMARRMGMHFATTLTVSPHKSSHTIFEIGREWNGIFEPWDFKKHDGFKRSIENSRAWGLYRQSFCGCEFSKRDSEKYQQMKEINMNAEKRAEDFVENEKQFHLGFLPTEQSNSLSRTLESDFRQSPVLGVRTLQRVDREVLPMLQRVYQSPEYRALSDAVYTTIKKGGKVVFSGCGATGRLSILLESMWRTACRDTVREFPQMEPYGNHVFSIMTGGDFALVKSVEFFEDYACFGKRQVADLGMGPGDVLVAITEGGETSSVLGTVSEAADRGAGVFLLFNNPAELLAENLERSEKAIHDKRVTVLDLYCGPMALAGSTRMQATTSEQMIAGGALETAFCRLAGLPVPDYAVLFEQLLDRLESDPMVKTMSDYIVFENQVYSKHGKVTYFTHDNLLDIFTDTTERSPTFTLPPFRGIHDHVSAQSWAFVKDVFHTTADAWRSAMARPLRCLNWTMDDYKAMNVADRIQRAPAIGQNDLLDFQIGCEPAPERSSGANDVAVVFSFGKENSVPEFRKACVVLTASFPVVRSLALASSVGDFSLPNLPDSPRAASPLRLIEHTAVKLVLNTISTGTMVLNGRVSGNWMSYVTLSNKKLIDRGIRLLAELGKLSYHDAAVQIFRAMEVTADMRSPEGERICAVQYALTHLPPRP